MASENLQLTRLHFDMPAFYNRLHQELLDELYPTLATTATPSPYKVTQEDIDDALRQWNGDIKSKHAVVRYMEQHGRDIHVSDEDVAQHRWHEPEETVAEAPEAASPPQKEPFPYSVGDTVYLENGKPYIIESIGLFDISLRDPTLFYPISRAESRESFARLMERYPQPEKTAQEQPQFTTETVAFYPG